MMVFQNNYKDALTTLCDALDSLESAVNSMYDIKENAAKQVVSEETSVNDLLHFLELEKDIKPKVLERTATLIGDCRKIRRDAKMVLQDFSNLNNVSDVKLGEFTNMCKTLKETISNFKHVFEKDLEYKPKKIDFEKLKGDAVCVAL